MASNVFAKLGRRARVLSLARRYANGDRGAGDLLLLETDRLVRFVARQHCSRWLSRYGEDLLQQGRLGVLEAAVRFDWTRENAFSTYALYWIRQRMTRWVIDCGYLVRVPVGQHRLGVVRQSITSLDSGGAQDAPIPTELLHEELQCDPEADELDDLTLAEACEEVAGRALGAIGRRQAAVLRRRLMNEPSEFLEEIAQSWGISRERVRQIESEGIAQVRAFMTRLGAPAERAPTFEDWIEQAMVGLRNETRQRTAALPVRLSGGAAASHKKPGPKPRPAAHRNTRKAA